METITDAKSYLRANFETGVHCPCCAQFVKRYKRKIGSHQIVCLINLYKLTKAVKSQQYFHITNIFTGHPGDFAKLSYWGFISEQPNADKQKRTSGYWALTNLGEGFLLGKETVPKFVYVYNQSALGFDGPEVNVRECLSARFNYDELMRQQ